MHCWRWVVHRNIIPVCATYIPVAQVLPTTKNILRSENKGKPHHILSEWLALVINFSLWCGGSCCCYCHILFIVSALLFSFSSSSSLQCVCMCVCVITVAFPHICIANLAYYEFIAQQNVYAPCFQSNNYLSWACVFFSLSNELKRTYAHTRYVLSLFALCVSHSPSSKLEQNNKEKCHNM